MNHTVFPKQNLISVLIAYLAILLMSCGTSNSSNATETTETENLKLRKKADLAPAIYSFEHTNKIKVYCWCFGKQFGCLTAVGVTPETLQKRNCYLILFAEMT